jgi:hypothetical protein
MNGNVLAFSQLGRQQTHKVRRSPDRGWDPAIHYGEGNELHTFLATQGGLLAQAKLVNLVAFKETDDGINPLGSPTG